MKNKKIPVQKYNRKIVERGEINTSNTQIDDSSLSWLDTGTSIKSTGAKLVLWSQTSTLSDMMRPCKFFPHMSKIPIPTYNMTNSVIINNAIILQRCIDSLRNITAISCRVHLTNTLLN